MDSFFFSSRRRHTRWTGDWSSDVCSSDLIGEVEGRVVPARGEVPLRAIVEVPDAVERDALAVEVGVRQPGDVGLPVAVVRGRDPEPPHEDEGEGDEESGERPPAAR